MNELKLTTLQQLLLEKLNNADSLIKQVLDQNIGSYNFKRDSYYQAIDKHLDSFTKQPTRKNFWVIMGGLRGVGKTTLLYQLYRAWLRKINPPAKMFFLSLDEVYGMSADFSDIEKVIEYKLGQRLTSYKQPLYIFLDEVHFIDKWSVNAKIWHDRCPQLFLLCTGSSAISFWTNADIARRAQIIDINPLSLAEFTIMKIINHKDYQEANQEIRTRLDAEINKLNLLSAGISSELKQCLMKSQGVSQTFEIAEAQNNKFKKYIKILKGFHSNGIEINLLVEQYVSQYMSLPYVISEIEYEFHDSINLFGSILRKNFRTQHYNEKTINEETIRVNITQTLENIFNKDLNVLNSFNQATRAVFPKLMLALANNDATDLSTLSRKLKVNIQTLQGMIKVLIDSQVISAIPPLGASSGKISKAYKYLFNSPAIRQTLSPVIIGTEKSTDSQTNLLRGKLLEDSVHMSFRRIFKNKLTDHQVEYDASKGGADFIIMPRRGLKQKATIIEVGHSKKSHKQVLKTMERISGQGLVITDIDRPKLSEDQRVIYIPIKLFLMI